MLWNVREISTINLTPDTYFINPKLPHKFISNVTSREISVVSIVTDLCIKYIIKIEHKCAGCSVELLMVA